MVAARYRVISELGRGGMGSVLLAEHVGIGRKVALKVLSERHACNDEARKRFVAEARATARIGHAGIVEVLDAGELADGRPYLAMEYLEGSSLLTAVRRRGRFAVETALRIAREIADALVAAHAVGIVHRDLKSDNVMLVAAGGANPNERAKLLDFGIAAALLDDPSTRMTTPGLLIGTPAYMAPEQARGTPATPSFDVYALGAVLYEMLAGVTPFEGDDPFAVIAAKVRTPASSIATMRTDLPPALVELVDRCLAMEPHQRPADMVEVRARLDALLGALERTLARRRRAPRRRLAFAAVVASGLTWAATTALASVPPAVLAFVPAATVERRDDPASYVVPFEIATAAPATPPPHAAAPPDPAAPPPAAPTPIPTTRPRAPRLDSPACELTRDRAREAREAHDWIGLLRLVEHRRCWGAAVERDRLRVKATLELQRFAECVALGRNVRDPQVRKSVDLCRRRLATG